MSMPSPERLVFGEIVLDFVGRRVLRVGVEQPLEPKAFAVLMLLASMPGRVFTRDEILDAVWGHRHVTPAVLTRVMTLLRHALGESAHSPCCLHTVHGLGYRFDLPADPDVEPIAAESIAAESIAAESIAAESVAAEPVAAEPVAAEPVAAESIAAESVAAEPVAAEPVAAEPVAAEPVAAEPVAAEPVATEPAAAAVIADAAAGMPIAAPARRRRATDKMALTIPPHRRASDGRMLRALRRGVWPLLLLLLAGAGWHWWPQTPSPPTPAPPLAAVAPAPAAGQHSIAVLPLANVGGDKAQQFFSDGISENLIDTLSRYEGLEVIGRSSSFRFRDSQESSKSIGAQLGVAYLVAGSVQRAGERVRVNVELVDAADGRTLWTQRFDRAYRNLFALQDEIALAVAGWLQVKLPKLQGMAGAVEGGNPASGNLEAYGAYLRGSYYLLRDSGKAMEQFAEATRLDPGYAQAWQWLGFVRATSARGRLDGEAIRTDCALAQREIENAIRLAPNYGLGYSALAVQRSACDYDWQGALAQFHKAMPLVPASSPAHGQYSRLLATLGRVGEAIDERRKQLAGEPLMAEGYYWLFRMEAALGQLDDAETSLQRVIALTPPEEAVWLDVEKSYLALLRGDVATALVEARRLPPGSVRDQALALALQASDNRAEADAALHTLVADAEGSVMGPLWAARAYALRGDADGMFAWLDHDWARRGMAAYDVLSDPLLLRFRGDPRFAGFCARAGLPPPSASDALELAQIRARQAGKH